MQRIAMSNVRFSEKVQRQSRQMPSVSVEKTTSGGIGPKLNVFQKNTGIWRLLTLVYICYHINNNE